MSQCLLGLREDLTAIGCNAWKWNLQTEFLHLAAIVPLPSRHPWLKHRRLYEGTSQPSQESNNSPNNFPGVQLALINSVGPRIRGIAHYVLYKCTYLLTYLLILTYLGKTMPIGLQDVCRLIRPVHDFIIRPVFAPQHPIPAVKILKTKQV